MHRKRRWQSSRAGDSVAEAASADDDTAVGPTAAETTAAVQPYSQCSASVKSRRRAKLLSLLAELAGGSPTSIDEQTALLHDTLVRSADENARALYEGLVDMSVLGEVMGNVGAMYASLPGDRRAGVLALVANAFTAAELGQRWGIQAGEHQLQAARLLAAQKRFPVDTYVRSVPPSKAKKSDGVRRSVQDLVARYAAGSEVAPDGRRVLAAGESLRSLHRRFLEEHGDKAGGGMSFSTFRALVLEKFCLHGHAALEHRPRQISLQAGGSQVFPSIDQSFGSLIDSGIDSLFRPQDAAAAVGHLRGPHQLPASLPGSLLAVSAAATGAATLNTGAIAVQSSAQHQQHQQHLPPDLVFSSLGVGSSSSQRPGQQLALALPPLELPSLALLSQDTGADGLFHAQSQLRPLVGMQQQQQQQGQGYHQSQSYQAGSVNDYAQHDDGSYQYSYSYEYPYEYQHQHQSQQQDEGDGQRQSQKQGQGKSRYQGQGQGLGQPSHHAAAYGPVELEPKSLFDSVPQIPNIGTLFSMQSSATAGADEAVAADQPQQQQQNQSQSQSQSQDQQHQGMQHQGIQDADQAPANGFSSDFFNLKW
ncbi:hypothetical protein LPJ56_001003 [Coemansia sp. RSA 2599]|nr:hypothetical protein LPJ75_000558 [Coemansia sp. RSA 2598]KAJ1828615.1 hypothetical protein LPJ56_001003 [Coemansia sp. RSA 2599]